MPCIPPRLWRGPLSGAGFAARFPERQSSHALDRLVHHARAVHGRPRPRRLRQEVRARRRRLPRRRPRRWPLRHLRRRRRRRSERDHPRRQLRGHLQGRLGHGVLEHHHDAAGHVPLSGGLLHLPLARLPRAVVRPVRRDALQPLVPHLLRDAPQPFGDDHQRDRPRHRRQLLHLLPRPAAPGPRLRRQPPLLRHPRRRRPRFRHDRHLARRAHFAAGDGHHPGHALVSDLRHRRRLHLLQLQLGDDDGARDAGPRPGRELPQPVRHRQAARLQPLRPRRDGHGDDPPARLLVRQRHHELRPQPA